MDGMMNYLGLGGTLGPQGNMQEMQAGNMQASAANAGNAASYGTRLNNYNPYAHLLTSWNPYTNVSEPMVKRFRGSKYATPRPQAAQRFGVAK